MAEWRFNHCRISPAGDQPLDPNRVNEVLRKVVDVYMDGRHVEIKYVPGSAGYTLMITEGRILLVPLGDIAQPPPKNLPEALN